MGKFDAIMETQRGMAAVNADLNIIVLIQNMIKKMVLPRKYLLFIVIVRIVGLEKNGIMKNLLNMEVYMMIKVFTTNKDGKIELSKDELKTLLDEAYWEGYYKNNNYYTYSTPGQWKDFTCTSDININTINSTTTTTK